jgi:hypothetical protein
MATAGAGAGAAAAAAVQAAKAMGVIVHVAPNVFEAIVRSAGDALVVHAKGGVFKTHYRYLTSWKGLAFYTKSDSELVMPEGVALLPAEKIWVPE